jgi:TonB family protein
MFMKNLLSLLIGGFLLIFGGLACQNNPLAKFTKQYNCTVANEPEPVSAEDFVNRAYKHIELDNFSQNFNQCAFDATQEALRLDPKHAVALALRGSLFYAKRDYDAALNDLNESLRLDQKNFQAFRYRSRIFEEKNMPDQAIEDLSKVINLNASHFDYAARGNLYLKKGDLEKALQDFTEAIRIKPDYQYHYSKRAEIYRRLGKNAQAEADEAKLRDLDKSAQTEESQPKIKSSPSDASSTDSTNKPVPKTVSGGVLNGKATNLVKPPYPAAAKAVRASGAVNVQVTIDEQGSVISAAAVSGHPLLRASAVQAARSSKFSPTLLSGKPVKVTGVIVYNYVPE